MPSKRYKRRPTKQELARWKVMQESGLTAHAIGQQVGRDHKTVMKYLQSPVYHSDGALGEMVELIKKRELEDLYLLGAKGRHRLHELLDQGKTRMIETIALVDRTFQQRRLLEGGTTAHVSILGKLIIGAERSLGIEAIQAFPQSDPPPK